jgi:hypothetical protein
LVVLMTSMISGVSGGHRRRWSWLAKTVGIDRFRVHRSSVPAVPLGHRSLAPRPSAARTRTGAMFDRFPDKAPKFRLRDGASIGTMPGSPSGLPLAGRPAGFPAPPSGRRSSFARLAIPDRRDRMYRVQRHPVWHACRCIRIRVCPRLCSIYPGTSFVTAQWNRFTDQAFVRFFNP